MSRSRLLPDLSISVMCSRAQDQIRRGNSVFQPIRNRRRLAKKPKYRFHSNHTVPAVTAPLLWRTFTKTDTRTAPKVQWKCKQQRALQLRVLQTLSDRAIES